VASPVDEFRSNNMIIVIATPRLVAVEVECTVEGSGAWSIRCPDTGLALSGPAGHDRSANPSLALFAIVDAALAIGKRNEGQDGLE
jgi:hypothetical protein